MVGSEAPMRAKPLSSRVPMVRALISAASRSNRELGAAAGGGGVGGGF